MSTDPLNDTGINPRLVDLILECQQNIAVRKQKQERRKELESVRKYNLDVAKVRQYLTQQGLTAYEMAHNLWPGSRGTPMSRLMSGKLKAGPLTLIRFVEYAKLQGLEPTYFLEVKQ